MTTSPSPAKPGPWTDRKPRAFGSLTPDEYVTERLNPVRAWYDKEASKAKSLYLRMRTTTVIGGAVVPVLINMNWPYVKELTTLISLLVVVLLSLESVMHYREQWKSYRSTEQALEKEYYNFAAAEGPYRGMSADEAFLEFVDRVESAVASENAATLNVMTTVSEGSKPPRGDDLTLTGLRSMTATTATTATTVSTVAAAAEPAPAPQPAAPPPEPAGPPPAAAP